MFPIQFASKITYPEYLEFVRFSFVHKRKYKHYPYLLLALFGVWILLVMFTTKDEPMKYSFLFFLIYWEIMLVRQFFVSPKRIFTSLPEALLAEEQFILDETRFRVEQSTPTYSQIIDAPYNELVHAYLTTKAFYLHIDFRTAYIIPLDRLTPIEIESFRNTLHDEMGQRFEDFS